MYVCVCKSITDRDLADSWAAMQPDPERLAEELGLQDDDCCGYCAEHIDDLVDVAALRSFRLQKAAL